MADEKKRITNETLAAQRRERQEFLKLKRAQSGEEAYEKGPTLEEVMPKTFWGKLQNFVYHTKVPIIIVLVLAVLFGVATAQCINKEKYDIELVAYSFSYIMDEQLKVVEEQLESFCEDVDENGEKNISTVNCTFNKNNASQNNTFANNAEYTSISRYQAIIVGDPQATLFLLDQGAFDQMVERNKENPFFEDEIAYLSDEIYQEVKEKTGFELPEGLIIAYRRVEGTTIAKDKISSKCHDAAKKIVSDYNEKYTIPDGENKND